MSIYPLGAGFAGASKASRAWSWQRIEDRIATFIDERMSVVGSLVRAALRGRDFWVLQVLVPVLGFLGAALAGLFIPTGVPEAFMVSASAILWIAVVVGAVFMGVKSAVGVQPILSMYMGARKMLTWSYAGAVVVASMIAAIVASIAIIVILSAPSFAEHKTWISAWMPAALVISSACSSSIGFAAGLLLNRPWGRNLGIVAIVTAIGGTLIGTIPSYTSLVSVTGLVPHINERAIDAGNPWSYFDSAVILGTQLVIVVVAMIVVKVWVERSMQTK